MVLFFLYIKADQLENVGSLELNLKDSPNLCISVKNPLSDYEVREKVVINPNDYVEQDESAREPPHHLSIKWEGQKKASVGKILLQSSEIKSLLKKKSKAEMPRALTESDSEKFVPILALDCRGLEPTAFYPMGSGEFTVTSTGGKVFDSNDVDLSEGDWADYDDENDMPVSISDIQFKWEAVS